MEKLHLANFLEKVGPHAVWIKVFALHEYVKESKIELECPIRIFEDSSVYQMIPELLNQMLITLATNDEQFTEEILELMSDVVDVTADYQQDIMAVFELLNEHKYLLTDIICYNALKGMSFVDIFCDLRDFRDIMKFGEPLGGPIPKWCFSPKNPDMTE